MSQVLIPQMATYKLVTKDKTEKELTLIFTTADFKSWGKVAP